MYAPYVLREIGRRRSRAAAHMLAVAVIAALFISLTAVMAAYSSAVYLPFENSGADIVLQKQGNSTPPASGIRMPFGRSIFSEAETRSIQSLPHVQNASGSLVLWSFDKGSFTSIEGIEPASFMAEKLGSWLKAGSFDISSGNVVLESHFANFYHKNAGDRLTLGNETYAVSGIIKIKEGSELFASSIYMSLADARRLGGGGINQIYLKIDGLPNEKAVESSAAAIDPGITAFSGDSISASLGNVADIYSRFYWVGMGFVLLVSALLLFKINAADLLERRREIGILQSVGWVNKDVTKQICSEALVKTLAGFAMGALASCAALSFLGAITLNVQSNVLGSAEAITMPLQIPIADTVWYFLLMAAISFIVSYILARRMSKQKPSANLKSI